IGRSAMNDKRKKRSGSTVRGRGREASGGVQGSPARPKARPVVRPVASGAPIRDIRPIDDIILKPRPRPKLVGNLFDPDRKGSAVVRPDDLLAMRIEARNLGVVPGAPPRLVKTGQGTAYLILHFPPQAITEETFFEARPPGTVNPEDLPDPPPNPNTKPKPDAPGGSEDPRTPPIRARIAGESRLVFKVPNDFDIPYTLEGVLDACQTLTMNVVASARPPTG